MSYLKTLSEIITAVIAIDARPTTPTSLTGNPSLTGALLTLSCRARFASDSDTRKITAAWAVLR